jgi:hypothetical protein
MFDILLNVRLYVCSETYLFNKMSVQKYEIRTYIGRKFVILKLGFRKNNVVPQVKTFYLGHNFCLQHFSL